MPLRFFRTNPAIVRMSTRGATRAETVRKRNIALWVVVAVCAVALLASTSSAPAASSESVVTASVTTATYLDVRGCSSAAATAFGSIAPMMTAVTGAPCDIKFGSSNSTSRLDLVQADQSGPAMQSPSDTMSLQSAARRWYTIEKVKGTGTLIVSGGAEKGGEPTPLTRSTDGGATWTGSVLNGIETKDMFASASSTLGSPAIFVGGDSNKMYKSVDDGVTWTSNSPSPSASNIRAIEIWDVAGSDTIWAAGALSKISHSTDGGSTWAAQSLPAPYTSNTEIRSISAASATDVWLWATTDGFSDPVMFHTIDGGTIWTKVANLPASTGSAQELIAVSATEIWATGNYGIACTGDGGSSWTFYGRTTYAMSILGSNVLFAGPGTGTFLVSSCGGALGPNINGNGGDLRSVTWVNATTAVAVGHGDSLLRSTDTAGSWAATGTSQPAYADATYASDGTLWIAGSMGTILKSIDGGASTTPMAGIPSGLSITSIDTVSPSVIIATARGGKIYRSADGGATWDSPPSGVPFDLNDVDMRPDGLGMIAGNSGVILTTSDAGHTWTQQAAGTGAHLFGIAMTGSSTAVDGTTSAWVVGSSGTIRKSTDLGTTWTAQTSAFSGASLTEVSIVDIDDVWIGGGQESAGVDGALLHTTNGGTTWTQVTTNTKQGVNAVETFGSNTILITSFNGVARSNDDGATWNTASSGANLGIYAIAATDTNHIIAVGNGKLISRSDPVFSIPDYAGNWSGGSAFGACLHTASNATGSAWGIPVGAGNCTTGNPTNWHPIPAVTQTLATSTGVGNISSAQLLFALRTANAQKPGNYTAGLQFSVIAP